jgi:hypothetical protein
MTVLTTTRRKLPYPTDPTEYVPPTFSSETETDPISETLGSLEYRTMEKV